MELGLSNWLQIGVFNDRWRVLHITRKIERLVAIYCQGGFLLKGHHLGPKFPLLIGEITRSPRANNKTWQFLLLQ